MAVVSKASTAWTGDLESGSGQTNFDTSGLGTFDVSWQVRTSPGPDVTTPEELLAAAHASCFSMALAHELTQSGTPPTSIDTSATVTFEPGTGITGISLVTQASVEGIEDEAFQEIADGAKSGCPVSQALAGVDISLQATLA